MVQVTKPEKSAQQSESESTGQYMQVNVETIESQKLKVFVHGLLAFILHCTNTRSCFSGAMPSTLLSNKFLLAQSDNYYAGS
jgi:hypothetical protein